MSRREPQWDVAAVEELLVALGTGSTEGCEWPTAEAAVEPSLCRERKFLTSWPLVLARPRRPTTTPGWEARPHERHRRPAGRDVGAGALLPGRVRHVGNHEADGGVS